MMRLLALLLALLALASSGCLGCTPLLDVRACAPGDGACVPPDAVVATWGAAEAAAWPEVDALLGNVTPGKHLHAPWTQDPALFWADMGVDGQKPEVFIEKDGTMHRVRILVC